MTESFWVYYHFKSQTRFRTDWYLSL